MSDLRLGSGRWIANQWGRGLDNVVINSVQLPLLVYVATSGVKIKIDADTLTVHIVLFHQDSSVPRFRWPWASSLSGLDWFGLPLVKIMAVSCGRESRSVDHIRHAPSSDPSCNPHAGERGKK